MQIACFQLLPAEFDGFVCPLQTKICFTSWTGGINANVLGFLVFRRGGLGKVRCMFRIHFGCVFFSNFEKSLPMYNLSVSNYLVMSTAKLSLFKAFFGSQKSRNSKKPYFPLHFLFHVDFAKYLAGWPRRQRMQSSCPCPRWPFRLPFESWAFASQPLPFLRTSTRWNLRFSASVRRFAHARGVASRLVAFCDSQSLTSPLCLPRSVTPSGGTFKSLLINVLRLGNPMGIAVPSAIFTSKLRIQRGAICMWFPPVKAAPTR